MGERHDGEMVNWGESRERMSEKGNNTIVKDVLYISPKKCMRV